MKSVYARCTGEEGGVVTLDVVGQRPEHRPYLRIETADGTVASVDSAVTLRRLARGILKALGDD